MTDVISVKKYGTMIYFEFVVFLYIQKKNILTIAEAAMIIAHDTIFDFQVQLL